MSDNLLVWNETASGTDVCFPGSMRARVTLRFCLLATSFLLAMGLGCRSVPELPAFNLKEDGWLVRSGQAIWRPALNKPELAGDLLAGVHRDGRSIVQFVKTPFPLVIARTALEGWEIEFVPQQRELGGRGQPSDRFVWFQIAPVLLHAQAPSSGWRLDRDQQGGWVIEHTKTGESLKGYLGP